MTRAEIDACEAAFADADRRALIKAAQACHFSASTSGTYQDLWCAAMTIAYGPLGTHKSRCDENDHPTDETKALFPAIQWAIDKARERVPELIERAREEARS